MDIEHAGGTTRVFVNQKQVANGGIWNVLGAYTFNAGVTYRITITAQPYPDSSSTTCADAVKFVYLSGGGNIPPAAIIDSIAPNPALPGQTVTFIGHGTDSDGSIAAYEWRSSIDGLLSSLNTFSTSTLAAGTHTIALRVQDNEGVWSSEVSGTLQVSGGVNILPVAIIDSITPNPALPGQTVTFTGHGTDSDGSIAAYEWRSSIDGLLSPLWLKTRLRP